MDGLRTELQNKDLSCKIVVTSMLNFVQYASTEILISPALYLEQIQGLKGMYCSQLAMP